MPKVSAYPLAESLSGGETLYLIQGGSSKRVLLSTVGVYAIATAVSDEAYNASTWNGVAGVAPSKNAVRDQVETMRTSIAAKAGAGANTDITSLTGTTTNDNAAAGKIGEYLESEVLVGAAVSVTTGTDTNITSLSLTAGDWDVSGNVDTNPAGGTTTQFFQGWVSSVSATAPTRPNKGGSALIRNSGGLGVASENQELSFGPRRFSVAVTTTVYLGTRIVFTGSTMTAYGCIRARRVR